VGQGMLAVIHCEPRIPWQPKRAAFFAEGFHRTGIPSVITADRFRHDEGFSVLLGTTLWRDIERTGDYLLVDRCSFGDTEKFVSLVWNGHGRRGDHRVPRGYSASRWERIGEPLEQRKTGSRAILCGQTETYSPHWRTPEEWYATVQATHFRKHPAGKNPTGLPEAGDFSDCGRAIALNSSVAVKCVIAGIPTDVHDEGCMAWDVRNNSLERQEREPWAHWLAWTQWSDDEIREGAPWVYQL
jgi:hypothetical protein